MFPKGEHRNQRQDTMDNAKFQRWRWEVQLFLVPLGSQSDAEEEEERMKLDFTRQEQSSVLGLLQ